MIDPTPDTGNPRAAAALRLCERKLASSDIGLHYGVLFAARAQRAALTALYAFWHEVREINYECTDPEIARVKFAWWHEEIQEALAGRPRHPIGIALALAAKAHPLPGEQFGEIIEAMARHAGATGYTTYAQLCDHGLQTRGRLERLAAQIMDCQDPGTLAAVAEIGARLELVALFRDTGVDARRQRCYLPQEDLARFGVDPANLRAAPTTRALGELIAVAAQRLDGELERQLAQVTTRDQTRLVTLLVAAQTARLLLRRISANSTRLLHERPALLPLRQLWVAWRTARRSRARSRNA